MAPGSSLRTRCGAVSGTHKLNFLSFSNVGVVPLFNAYGEYRLSERWRAIFDFDGLVGPSGRAFDIGVKAAYGLTRDLSIEGGYRSNEREGIFYPSLMRRSSL